MNQTSTVEKLKKFSRTKTFWAAAAVLGGISLMNSQTIEKFTLEMLIEGKVEYTTAKVVGKRIRVGMDDSQCSPAFDHKYEILIRKEDGTTDHYVACIDEVDGPMVAKIDKESRTPTSPFKRI